MRSNWMVQGRPVVAPAGQVVSIPRVLSRNFVNPAGQVVATDTGYSLATSIVGLAIAFGVTYAGAYFGAKRALRR